MNHLNYFGREVPSLKEMVSSPKVIRYLTQCMTIQLREIGISDPKRVTSQILGYAALFQGREFQLKCLDHLGEVDLSAVLTQRTRTVFEQVHPYVIGSQVLDYGCSSGDVGRLLALQGHEVTLADVYHDPAIQDSDTFALITNNRTSLEDNTYDTTLLLTVLHHCASPQATIQEARRLTKPGGRIISIESVYGVHDDSDFGRLSDNEQWNVAAFIDYLANKLLLNQDDLIPVPFNYLSPEKWEDFFRANGLEQEELHHLQIEQPALPEYHVRQILRVL